MGWRSAILPNIRGVDQNRKSGWAMGAGDDRNAPNCLWLIESRVRSDGTPAHPRGFLTLDGSSDAGLSEVREDSFLWVSISPRYSAIRQSGLNSGFLTQ
jgi:hypothetical protein